jgi:hypothetical protein
MKLKPYDPDSELNIHLGGKAKVSRTASLNQGWSGSHTAQRLVPCPTLYSQQSIVVVEFVKAGSMQSGRATKLTEHTRYLQKEQQKNMGQGTVLEAGEEQGQNKSAQPRAELFNAEHDKIRSHMDMAEERSRLGPSETERKEALKKEMDRTPEVQWTRERHHFRFVVSPDNSHKIDMRTHVRSLMKEIERDQGTKLQWYAVIHRDTEHVHAHVVLRGRRDDGHNLFLDRAYIKEGIRHRSQDLATKELGLRRRDKDVIEQEQLMEKRQRDPLKEETRSREKLRDAGPEISR